MIKMKKSAAILSAIALVASMAGCGGGSSQTAGGTAAETAASSAAAEAESAAAASDGEKDVYKRQV